MNIRYILVLLIFLLIINKEKINQLSKEKQLIIQKSEQDKSAYSDLLDRYEFLVQESEK